MKMLSWPKPLILVILIVTGTKSPSAFMHTSMDCMLSTLE